MGGPLEPTGDTVKAGDTSQPGANVVFMHEPTFYNDSDEVSFLQNDPVYRAKVSLLEETGLVVYRLHDYPDQRTQCASCAPTTL